MLLLDVADQRGRRPRGASEKSELAHVARLVRRLDDSRDENMGLALTVTETKGGRIGQTQTVLVHASDGLIVDWDAADVIAERNDYLAHEQVRLDIIAQVRRRPRQLTKSESRNPAELAGSRDQRRSVVDDLVHEDKLEVVQAKRSERGVQEDTQCLHPHGGLMSAIRLPPLSPPRYV